MANEQERKQDPASESDISKSQSQQLPQQAAQQQPETGQQGGQFETGQQGREELTGEQASTGQSQTSGSPDAGTQGDTLTQQRTDIEGAAGGTPESGEAESGFVGAQGKQDTSSELVEEEGDEEFGRDGQGAPEGE